MPLEVLAAMPSPAAAETARSGQGTPARPASRSSDETEGEKKIKEALNSPTELDFTETPLQDVVDYLKEQHKIEIQLDTKALDDVGIGSRHAGDDERQGSQSEIGACG